VPEIWTRLGLKGNPFCGLLNIINGLNWQWNFQTLKYDVGNIENLKRN
jgi:hypothetical protein